MLSVLLVCLAVTSALAQSCIPGAERDPENGKCVCSPGLTGHGDLCCHSPVNYKSCHVAGDPVLTSFTGRKAGLNFLCGTLVSSTENGDSCRVDVYASSKEMRSGVLYTSKVKVVLINYGDSATFDFDFADDPPQFEYKLNGAGSGKTAFSAGGNSYRVFDSDVKVIYDSGNQLIKVTACDTIIHVRPAKGENPNAGKTPGLCVMANPAASYANQEQECGLNQELTTSTDHLINSVRAPKNYIFPAVTLSSSTSSSYAGLCNNYRNIMSTKCVYADRENALKKCAFILLNPLVRKCFFESATGPVQGRVWNAYTNCLDAYCTGDKDLCTNLQADRQMNLCASSLLNCQTWPPYRRVNRFVAGEGEETNFGNGEGNENPEETTWNPLGNGGILGGNENQEGTGGGEGGFNPDDFGL